MPNTPAATRRGRAANAKVVKLRRARQRRYLARKGLGKKVISISADPTDVIDFLHIAGVHVPDPHTSTIAICLETLIELALDDCLRVERRPEQGW
jgi:hypothetical protein